MGTAFHPVFVDYWSGMGTFYQVEVNGNCLVIDADLELIPVEFRLIVCFACYFDSSFGCYGISLDFGPLHEMQKLESELWIHAWSGPGHAAYNLDRFYLLTPKVGWFRAKAVQISACLTDLRLVRKDQLRRLEVKEECEELAGEECEG
ncbi:hypothetical protein Tco_1238899 [Tanacetum coccineum]